MKRIDIKVNDVFHKFTIVEEDFSRSRRYFFCDCECGVRKSVMLKHILSGATRSCGCLSVEVGLSNVAHLAKIRPTPRLGKPHTNFYEHGSWRSMRMRCLNKKYKGYHLWGGRGITICERWQGVDGFKNFLADMGPRPSGYSIERINNDGNYNKDNCKWATAMEQANNTRSTNK
jgi:hypothetical protein